MKKNSGLDSSIDKRPHTTTNRELPKPYVICAYAFLFILFLVFGTILFSSQSNWCGVCHAVRDEVSSWKVSAHTKMDCLSCHRNTGIFSIPLLQLRGLKNFFSNIFNSYTRPISTDVESRFCLNCHPTIIEKVVESSSIRISHRYFTPRPFKCTDCHSDVGHRIKSRRKNLPNMDRCFSCHDGTKASAECGLCHTKELPEKITANSKSPYLIVHGAQGKKTHGMGDQQTCQICHRRGFCQQCHQVNLPHDENISYTHSQEAKISTKPCLVCHQQSYCDGCHGLEMPHPADFISQHPKLADSNGIKTCKRCHVDYTCDYCHRKAIHPPPLPSHQPRLVGAQ